jgi:hypothetical protein
LNQEVIFRCLKMELALKRSCVFLTEICGRVVRNLAQDQKILGSNPGCTRSLYIHMFTSAAHRLSSGWIACDSCTQKTLWDHSKRVGESPRSWASNSGRSRNQWASMVPNHSDRHNAQWANVETELTEIDPP